MYTEFSSKFLLKQCKTSLLNYLPGKFLQFCRAFSLYLSSLVLICLTVDRYYAVLHPLKVVNASKRVKLLLSIAWISAALLAIPQVNHL